MQPSDFSTLFDLLPIGAYRSTVEGQQLRANPALVRLNGYGSEEELLASVNDIAREWYVDPGRRQQFRELITRDGQVVNFCSEVYRHKTRERIWVKEDAHLVKDTHGRPMYYEGTVEDVTEGQRAHLALQERERWFRALTDKAQVLTIVCSPVGDIVYVSQAAQVMLGRAPADLQGSNLFDWMHPQDQAGARREHVMVGEFANSGTESIYRYLHADGSWRYLASLASNCLDDSAVQGIVLNFRDATERKRAELAELELRTNEERWKLAMESAGDGLWDWDLVSGRTVYSARFKEMYGYPDDQPFADGEAFEARTHPDDQQQRDRARQAHLDGHTPCYVNEHRVRCRDGSWKWVLSRGMVIRRDGAGRPLRMIGTHTDITARKVAEAESMALNAELAEKTRLLQTTLGSISQGIFMVGVDGRIDSFNTRVCELLGLTEAFLEGRPTLAEITRFQMRRGDFGVDAQLVDERARPFVRATADNIELPHPTHYLRTTLDGRTLEVKTQSLPSGALVRTFADVTDYVQAERARKRLHLLLEATQSLAHVGGWEVDLLSGQMVWTDEVYRILEISPQAYTPTLESMAQFFPGASADRVRLAVEDAEQDGAAHGVEIEMLTARGRLIWVHSVSMVTREHGRVSRRISIIQDITSRKQSEALVWQQANFDTLTGLPNRRMLRDRLEQELKKSRRDGRQLAILFIDLDHFKEVNDTLGHDAGDALLVEAARRIRSCVRESDTVARMGGDEFTVVLPELHDGEHLERIVQGLLRAMATLFQIGREQVYVSASVGITMYPRDATEVESLFKNADQALYVAKGSGRNRFSFFTPALQEAAQNRVRLANDLRLGLSEQQFRVVYQPIVELGTGAVHKAEALIRWQHPQRGLVSPAEFIPIAESGGLIIEIGSWVFRQAAAQAKRWRQQHGARFQISVNKSPVQFHNDAGRQQSWLSHLQELGLDGGSVVVEITEGLLLDSSAAVTEQLLQLRDAGVQVSLDDFGTGYSSLTYLQRFDIDYIKIDQSFVRHLVPGCTELALCKAIIVMAHELGLKVIAEGVETQGQC
ncbi:MAG: EAL domain-containing protein, partial [Rhodoferax sp.]|nr:EAL domain-containing protein [Rhodoferax sp.]